MRTTGRLRILVAPLDWGLGHTTRCVPLIRCLLELGHEPVLAGNEEQLSYYRQEFPSIRGILLEGYNVSYARSGSRFRARILWQIPRLLHTIRKEHQWLLRLVAAERINGIISDNRYGLHHPSIPSVIMTHQLQVITGLGRRVDAVFRSLHYRFLEKFNACWVVDAAGVPNLSGALGHPSVLPALPLAYLGALTHLPETSVQTEPQEYRLLVLLSGPEPQRSLLSDLLWKQVQGADVRICFVEGSPYCPVRVSDNRNLDWYGRVGSAELQRLLAVSELVLCRSGYSTVMDLAVFGKKAIFIPTPGQTEQEYLAAYLEKSGMGIACRQKDFHLETALSKAWQLSSAGRQHFPRHPSYRQVLEQWLLRLSATVA